LGEVLPLAPVDVELLPDGGFIGRSEWGYGAKLHVAILANAKLRRFAHDPKFSLCHALAFPRTGLARFVGLVQVICKCHDHGRLHIRLERVSAN
jgi:hypothetical protein